TAFMAAVHDRAGSAVTLYRVPCCPWYFQLAPLTEPHNLPGGSPPLTPAEAVLTTASALKRITNARRLGWLDFWNPFIVEFLSIGVVARMTRAYLLLFGSHSK